MSQDARGGASKEHSSSSKALQDQGTAFEELSGSDARGGAVQTKPGTGGSHLIVGTG